MKLIAEEAREVVYEEHDDWVPANDEEIYDTSRWSHHMTRVFKHLPSGKHYQFYWSKGATEQQYEQAYEYDEYVEPVEVEPKEVTTIKWSKVK